MVAHLPPGDHPITIRSESRGHPPEACVLAVQRDERVAGLVARGLLAPIIGLVGAQPGAYKDRIPRRWRPSSALHELRPREHVYVRVDLHIV